MEKQIEEQVKRRFKGEARKKKQLRKAIINEDGSEQLDETPLFVEVGQKPVQTMDQKIRAITLQVQAETAAKLAAQNLNEEDIQKLLDEENDFEIPDDFNDNLTVYEAQGIVSDLEENIQLEVQQAEEPDVSGQTPEPSTSSSPAEQSGEAATGGEATA